MNHERLWHDAEISAKEITRNLFKTHGLKSIHYHQYDGLDTTATITQFSLNVLTYIVENNSESIAKGKIEEFNKCLSCDLETFIK